MLFEQHQQQCYEVALILNINFQQQDQEMMEQDNLPEVGEVEHVDDENNNVIINDGEEDYNNLIINQGDDEDNNVDIIENIIIMDQDEGEESNIIIDQIDVEDDNFIIHDADDEGEYDNVPNEEINREERIKKAAAELVQNQQHDLDHPVDCHIIIPVEELLDEAAGNDFNHVAEETEEDIEEEGQHQIIN
jgi:hypothetical protein